MRARVWSRDAATMVILYFLAFWPLLLNAGIFWDDWMLYHQRAGTIRGMFAETGMPLSGWIDSLFAMVSPLWAKWFVFFAFLLAMLVLYRLLKEIGLFDRWTVLALTLIATLIPLNTARIATITISYTLCYLLFLCGFWFLVRYLSTHSLPYRIGSIAAFLIAFNTNSILVFYLIPLLFIAYHVRYRTSASKSVLGHALRYADFIAIPFLFFAVKQVALAPSGIYSDYNSLSFAQILASPYEFLVGLTSSFLAPIGSAILSGLSVLGVLALIWYVVHRLARPVGGSEVSDSYSGLHSRLLAAGAFFFYLGLLPYIAVGRTGSQFGSEWMSRDQLLLPIGAAFMLLYAIRYGVRRLGLSERIEKIAFSFLIASFIVANMAVYLHFQVDWFKQVAFMENVKQQPVIAENTTFVVDDRTPTLNAIRRVARFYEYNGLLKQAYGNETRLAANENDMESVLSDPKFIAEHVRRPQYNFTEYRPGPVSYRVIVSPKDDDIGIVRMVHLLAKEVIAPSAFREEVGQMLTLEVVPFAPTSGS